MVELFTQANLILVAVFVGVASLIGAGLTFWRRYDHEIDERLDVFAELRKPTTPVFKHSSESESTGAIHRLLRRLVPNQAEAQSHYQEQLVRAGIYSTSGLGIFYAAKLICMSLPTLCAAGAIYFGWIEIQRGVILGCAAGMLGMMLPGYWVDRQVQRRSRTLRNSLPDFLDLMVICMESGMSAEATVGRVTDELRLAHPVLAGEMGFLFRDMELGARVDDAFQRFADRNNDESLRTLATFIREARRFGTSLAHALRTHADTIRLQREQQAEEYAQKAAVKILLPTLLFIFPAIFVVLAGPAILQIQEAFAK